MNSFDPYNVGRSEEDGVGSEVVQADDYDALLALYHDTRKALEMAVQVEGKGKFISGLTADEWIMNARASKDAY
jgi:hypothetical protein